MEKAVVFGPMIVFFGVFALLIILFLGFIVKLVLKSKNEEWTGEVVDKKVNEIEDDNGIKRDYYYLEVKMEAGRDRKIALSQPMWDGFKIGDRLHKPKGKLWPEKIS